MKIRTIWIIVRKICPLYYIEERHLFADKNANRLESRKLPTAPGYDAGLHVLRHPTVLYGKKIVNLTSDFDSLDQHNVRRFSHHLTDCCNGNDIVTLLKWYLQKQPVHIHTVTMSCRIDLIILVLNSSHTLVLWLKKKKIKSL